MSNLAIHSSSKQERHISGPYSRTDHPAGNATGGRAYDGIPAADAIPDKIDAPAAIMAIGRRAGSVLPEDRFYGYHRQPAFLSALAARHDRQRGHVAVPAVQTPLSRAATGQADMPGVSGQATDIQDSSQSLSSPSSTLSARPAMTVMEFMSDSDEGGFSVSAGDDGGGMDGSDNGEGITVTGSPPSSGDGGSDLSTSDSTMPYTPPAPPASGASTEHITVHGHAVTVINGVAYLTSDSGNGIATYQSSSGAYVPIKLSDIDQNIADDTQNLLGRSASESDYNSAYQQFSEGQSPNQVRNAMAHSSGAQAALQNVYHDVLGRDIDPGGLTTYENGLGTSMTLSQVRTVVAYSQEAQNDVNAIYQQVLGRPVEAQALGDTENGLATGMTLAQFRSNTAHSQEAQNDINSIYLQVLGRNADPGGMNSAEDGLATNLTLDQLRYNTAQSQEAASAVGNVYDLLLNRGADSGGLQTYQNELANGTTLNSVISEIAQSGEAGTQISNFLNGTLGEVSDDLAHAGQTMLTGITQAYETVKNYTSDQLQAAANGFQATFSSAGNVLDSLMPKTQDQWLGLAATMAVMVTPAGEAVAAADLLAVGGEELLATALDAELDTATVYSATGASVSGLSAEASATFDELTAFDPKASGATLQLDANTTVTQVASTRYQKQNLNFSGGNEAAVETFFRKLTGYTGNLDNAKVASFGNDGVVYSVQTSRGLVSLRNVSASGKDWTIQFAPLLSNGVRKIKFEF
ncbi:DUF4214 domain-containing protein [Gluconacetobacter sp. 1b LMG 1731]|uniref:DUF4214 domain-containing protein n=1 Tax=Gluconacetobacter dulcium TaxID=2729096 RepID=A0A7W4INN0_9PROT|nr:DUF4214 domain-containing protein [Gluconacetobacter dulcium]MBB2166239.1 DUF4214 domain-containing protein [Gluconacetobacter dulcium]MBB2195375.1 DUF4214 domain-containing protein [Gluconacetobacter dulcium]